MKKIILIIVVVFAFSACSKRNFTAEDFTSAMNPVIKDYDVSSDFNYNLWGAIDGRQYYKNGKLAATILVYATQNPQEEMRKLLFTQHIVVLDILEKPTIGIVGAGQLKDFEVVKNRNLVLIYAPDTDALIKFWKLSSWL